MTEPAEPPAPPADPLRFLATLWSVDHALDAASKRMQQRLGVTGPQRMVVRLLGRNPDLGPADLAATLRDHPSTLTGVLARLVAHGLITRTVHPEDRRRAVLALTPAGKVVDALREGTIEAAIGRALMRETAADVEVARRVLTTVVEELERGE